VEHLELPRRERAVGGRRRADSLPDRLDEPEDPDDPVPGSFDDHRADIDRHVPAVGGDHVDLVVGRPHAPDHLRGELPSPLVRALGCDLLAQRPTDAVARELGPARVLPAHDPVTVGDRRR
jgi:hypothetical protein